jgi:hypothetical protein
MANICMARVRVEPKQTDSGNPRFPAEAVKSRLLALYYDHFELADEDPDKVEIECGFRWAPPFDELIRKSACRIIGKVSDKYSETEKHDGRNSFFPHNN